MIDDSSHALFVRNEYRYADAIDNTVKAKNPSAREVSINTQLNAVDATAIANKHLADVKNPRVWEIEIQGVLDLSSFIGGPPSFIPNFPKYAKTTGEVKITAASVDYNAGTTIMEVRSI